MKIDTKGEMFTAEIDQIGESGRLYGAVSGALTQTWWHPDGRHCIFPSLDLPEEVLPAIRDSVPRSHGSCEKP